jgi:hypothetical protein
MTIIKPLVPKRILRLRTPAPPAPAPASAAPRPTGLAAADHAGIYAILRARDFQPWRIAAPADAPEFARGLALVLCHYGQDERRIAANHQALEWTLQSRPRPAIVFVEAAEEGRPCHFADLAGHGVSYLYRTVPEAGKGIWLKEALWSIGARHALADPAIDALCFLDADCEFCRQDWAAEISNALENCDVISPHAWGYYSNQPDAGGARWPKLTESAGRKAAAGKKGGFPGFALAMTRQFFAERLHGRVPLSSNGGGDTLLWQLLRGVRDYGQQCAHYNFTFDQRAGMRPRPRTGCGAQILCHHYHGPFSERGYFARSAITIAATEAPMTEYCYQDDGMPVWNLDLPGGRILAKAYPAFRAAALAIKDKADPAHARRIYDRYAEQEYGAIDADNPLVVACLLRTGGVYAPRHVLALRDQFRDRLKTPHRFVCLSDVAIDGVETLPLTFTRDECPGWWGQVEYFQRGLFPPAASVLTCDLDNVLLNDFTMHQCPSGSFFTGRQIGAWLKSVWSVWNFGVTFWRGNFDYVYDTYAADIRHSWRHPHYQHISVQEYIYDCLRTHGVFPRDVEAHVMTRFYNGPEWPHPPGTAILQFPDRPKPWELNPKPAWLPAEIK